LLLLDTILTPDWSSIERSFNFTVGTALSVLLLTLAWRCTGENKLARFGYALCALVFSLGAGVAQFAVSSGQSSDSLTVVLAIDFAFFASAAWPVTILSLWAQGSFESNPRRRLGRVLIVAAGLSAMLLSMARVGRLLPEHAGNFPQMESPLLVLDITAYNAFFFLWLGAAILLPGRLRGRLSWISVITILTGITLVTLRAFEAGLNNFPSWLHLVLAVAKPFSLPLIVAGGLFGFSRFRSSDILAQKSLRILLGALLALASSIAAREIFGSLADQTDQWRGPAILGFAVLVWVVIVCYAKISRLSDWLVDRQIFRQTDYQRALKSFRESIATQAEPAVIFQTGETLVRSTLRIVGASIQSSDSCEHAGLVGADHARECLVPIQKGEDLAAFYLAVSPGPGRLTLFNAEIDFLREVCLAIGRRLESIDREKENIETARREAQLLKQLVEAELRALRAQINPHFLFNSLNSVAALIVDQPQAAEEMIIRLAKIFRHVLTYHDRPFSSVNEEITFLQTYLEIEKVRFGERLQVRFDIQESVKQVSVPTLILQPLVENSIKHGLGPKVGENQLTIRARKQTDYLELTVEDNGVGAGARKKLGDRNSVGLGLRNVEERLQTVYHGNASFSFESEPSGSCARIMIPILTLYEKAALVSH
jgi:two-component system, LytTR family, sensor kinase